MTLTPELVPLMTVRPVLVAFSKGDDHQSSMAAHFLRACDDPTCVDQATDLLALPGIIRGSLDVDAAFVDDDMRVAAVRAMVALAPGSPIARRRSPRRSSPPLVPSLVDRRLVPAVASSVASTAVASGAARARAPFDPNRIDEVLGCGLRVRNGTPTSHRPLNQRNYPAPESGPVRRCARSPRRSPRLHGATFRSTVARSRPFSEEILARPCACSISPKLPSSRRFPRWKTLRVV